MSYRRLALLREEGSQESTLPCSEVYAMVCRAVTWQCIALVVVCLLWSPT